LFGNTIKIDWQGFVLTLKIKKIKYIEISEFNGMEEILTIENLLVIIIFFLFYIAVVIGKISTMISEIREKLGINNNILE
jgi:hypothetical protein